MAQQPGGVPKNSNTSPPCFNCWEDQAPDIFRTSARIFKPHAIAIMSKTAAC